MQLNSKRKSSFLIIFLNLNLLFIKPISSIILTPPYFNLVANKRVTASATCGEGVREPELYCKLTGSSATDREGSSYANLIQGQYCDYCDPKDPNKNHHANYSIDGTDKWWQSPPLSRSLEYNQVNLTIDFGQEFHVAYIYIKMANSPRPGVWALEKSIDYGETFQPWQYFADTPSDCYNFFNTPANQRLTRDDEIICTTDFSKVLPVEGGEILVSLVNNRPNSKNFTHSDILQKWTRATNVRLRLMRTKNLLGHLMAVAKQDSTVTRRYFYSIRDISIGGRCVCNGHAQHCEGTVFMPDKLVCRCSHNTCGDQCETCCDGFVQKKWQPNRENHEFECEPCQCYGHSNECIYDEEIDKKKLSIDIHGKYEGGGVCQNCQHNTQGINCQECIPGYYRPYGVPITSVDACQKCACDSPYMTGNCVQISGVCECKPQYTGPNCTECANGYTDWPECKKCDCDINGRADSSCKKPCNCKFGYLGPFCDQCVDRYFGFPDCKPCDCEREGTLDLNCNKETGQCICRPGYIGLRCDQCDDGYFGERMCTLCNCDVGTVTEVCHKNNGTCICAPNFAGERCNECAPGFYNFPNCLPCNCDEEGSRGNTCTFFGNQPQCVCKEGRSGPRCDQCAPGYYKYPDCIECQCDEAGSIGQSCDPITGKCNCKSNFVNDKCSECATDFFNYPFCERCSCHPKGTADHFPGCNKELRMSSGIICPCKEYVTGRQCDKCKDRFYGLGSDAEKGCSACECNRNGTLNELDICEQNSGQCQCKMFVDSNSCNDCKPGFYKLERNDIFGCQSCNCLTGSSHDNNCDRNTGQCACLPNIVGLNCDQPAIGFYIPDLHQLKFEIEDGKSKEKKVRYDFDENIFPKFSWKGYVHLNRITGEVSQNVTITKSGTYRMIMRYLNKNTSISELSITVKELDTDADEQKAVLYLLPSSEPSFETVTVDQINALTLELEPAEYTFSFENKQDNLFIDYFVLLPSDYFESTVLAKDVVKACENYKNNEICIQYNYPSLDSFSSYAVYDSNSQAPSTDLDSLKEFNHSYPKPLIASVLSPQNSMTMNLKFPNPGGYVLLLDFMNQNNDGQDVQVEITHSDSNRRQSGTVYLYKCNITTLCREVLLSRDFNEPLKIDGKESANVVVKSQSGEILLYKLTLVPKDKFDINYIKMAPYCIVKNKRCLPLEYIPFNYIKIDLETDENSITSYRAQKQVYDHIPSNSVIYLHNYYPEVTIPVQTNRRDQGEQVLIVHYYQPNHPTVGVTVYLDKNTNGTFQANYCPSISGCRAIVKFYPNSDTFSNSDLQSIQFQLSQNGKDIWLDYVLLASATNVNPDVFNYAPIDMTSDFITQCASQHFNIDYYSNLFCDQSVLSLSAKYNQGAQPCDCNPDGSLETGICDYFGGQCGCKDNVIGRQCDRCKTGYFGFPNCQKCNCPTGNCDDITGVCVSPPNSDNNTCTDGYFGFHPIYGCDECNCNLDGTVNRDPVCDKVTGQCICKDNMDGRKCDQCKAGFYEYPVCNQCDCHDEGSLKQICDPSSSQCLCKENIMGERCDYCKQGTFNIESRNPKGCTQCFCFGQTTYCKMSDLYFSSENSLQDWKLTGLKQQNNINIIQSEEGLKLDLNEDESETKLLEPIYWTAPKAYLGNRVTSYGGQISYKLRIVSPDSSISMKPDLILSGQNMSLYYSSIRLPTNGEIFENTIDILESQFNHLLTGTSATRDQIMIVLSNLNEVKLRAIYNNKLHATELLSFEFDKAVEYSENITVDRPALSAEQCYCPSNFRGYSCESCEPGYYKVKGTGPGLFNCVPCQCNGHADQCDQETGECLNCRDNSLGKNCELCKPGHHLINYGNGRTECRLCPCPGPSDSNVFADSCMFDQNSNNVYHCSCIAGYAGQYCEKCAPGFYGDPTRPGGKCLPCQCNNNIDLNDYGSCDQRTGACLKCLNNTAGINCEKCADWHFGDPIILKNCRPCECDKLGSETCNINTGECVCKDNVIGYNCGSCGEDMWGFNKGEGCKKCDCDPVGSLSSQCDSFTGKCKCKPGIGGDKCDKCASGHWNFSSTGCQDCKCQGSFGGKVTNDGYGCDPKTGHCTCIEGVEGPKCDKCKPRWVLVKHVGCKKCDNCVHTLLDEVAELEMKAHGIENGNKDSSLTFKAHNKLAKLENEFNSIQASLDPSQYDSTPLLNLHRQIQSVQNDLVGLKLMTEYNINDKIKLLETLLADSELFKKDIGNLRINLDVLEQIIDDLERDDMKNFKNITDEQLILYENLVDQITRKDFGKTLQKYNDLVDEFLQANLTVQNLRSNYEKHTKQVEAIKEKSNYIQKSLMELKHLIDKAKSLDNFKEKDVEFKAYFDNLEQIRNETKNLQVGSTNDLQTIENMIKQGEEKLSQSNKDLVELNAKVEDLQEIYSNHDQKYSDLRQKCLQAEQKAQQMNQLAFSWKNKVAKSQEGLVAFEMAHFYEKIADTLNLAHERSLNILVNYTNADKQLDEITNRIRDLQTTGQDLSKLANDEIEKKLKYESEFNNLNNKYLDLDKKSKDLNKNLDKIDQWINRTLTSDQTLSNLKSELDNQQSDLTKHEEKAAELIRKVQSLETLRGSLPTGDSDSPSGEQLLKSIELSIDNLNTATPKLNQTVKDLLEQNNFNSELEKISKEIYDLKILIESTRQVVNDIKVAVNFNDSTVVNLKPPGDLNPSLSTTSSIYIKTKEAYAPIVLIYNESNPNEYFSLYLQQGKAHFQYKLSNDDSQPSVLATSNPINDNEWHKIQVERIGKSARLSVYSENNEQVEQKQSSENSMVFNLDPNGAKFILGQFPYSQIPNDLRTIAAYNNQFRGSMDSFKFNGQLLGLWNYLSAKNIKGELNRKFTAQNDKKEELETAQIEKGVYFMEDSFVCKNNTQKFRFNSKSRHSFDITLKFKTDSPNGLLWLWYTDDRVYYAIYLENGHINIAFSNSAQNKLNLFETVPSRSSYRLDDNKYHTIKVTVARASQKASQMEIKFKVVERLDQETEKLIDEVTYSSMNHIYSISNGRQCIGGMLATDREKVFKDSIFNSFIGCYVSVSLSLSSNFEEIVLNDKLHKPGFKSSNVVPECPTVSDQCEIKKSSTPVYLRFDLNSSQSENIGITFSTVSSNSVLFYRVKQDNKLLVQLKNSELILSLYDPQSSLSLKPKQKINFNDNNLHHVYVVYNQNSLELYVDNKLEDSITVDSFNLDEETSLYVAGVPSNERQLDNEEFNNFEGCLIQLIYNNQQLDLSKSTKRSNSMKFTKCYKTPIRSALIDIPGYKELQNTALINRYSQTILSKADLLTNQECSLSKQYDTSQLKSVGLRFGLSKQSRLEINDQFPIKISTFVSFKFRTLQANGLMFYASDAQFTDFISIWIQDGYVNYAFDCGSGFMHIKSKRIYNDGRYHTIMIKRDKQTGSLIISDRTNTTILESIENKSVGEASSLSVVEPYYFGNIPDSEREQLPASQSDLIITEPFVGCMSDFNIAHKLLRNNKINKVDLMNCSNNHESGLFFTGSTHTSHASLANSISLKEAFEISLDFKSRTKNGVLLYLSDSNDIKNYLLVEFINGEVAYKLSLDGQENLVKYVPDFARNELCNSSWIRLVLKKNEKGLITLNVKGVESSNSFVQDITYFSKRLTSNSSLYLGSLPTKNLYIEISESKEPFIGCIRDLGIKNLKKNSNQNQVLKVLLDMNLESGVLNYCPLK